MDFEHLRALEANSELTSRLAALHEDNRVLSEKVKVYERFLHLIQLHAEVNLDGDKVRKLIDRACVWSYAHRSGNGEYSEKEMEARIREAFVALSEPVSK